MPALCIGFMSSSALLHALPGLPCLLMPPASSLLCNQSALTLFLFSARLKLPTHGMHLQVALYGVGRLLKPRPTFKGLWLGLLVLVRLATQGWLSAIVASSFLNSCAVVGHHFADYACVFTPPFRRLCLCFCATISQAMPVYLRHHFADYACVFAPPFRRLCLCICATISQTMSVYLRHHFADYACVFVPPFCRLCLCTCAAQRMCTA